jgi:uncharacterized membrane-anchored protein
MASVLHVDVGRRELRPAWLTRAVDWFAGHPLQVLTLGVVFQLLVLTAMMVQPLTTLATGDTILLRVAPVDPRDLFRGDYVILSYDISRPTRDGSVAANRSWDPQSQLAGKTIYTRLAPDADGKHWHANGYQLEPPTEGKFIRGTAGNFGNVTYGIEQYFVQEGKGLEYEQAVSERKLLAEIVLDRNGNAQLAGLVIE